MAKKPVKKGNDQDLHQLRQILFGDQAMQTDDRISAAEGAINSIRRETRALREALELEASARIQSINSQGSEIEESFDSSMQELSVILIQQIEQEKEKRATHYALMAETLDAYRSSQDETTDQLITHLQAEKEARKTQFDKLKAAFAAEKDGQDEVNSAVLGLIQKFKQEHAEQNLNGKVDAKDVEASEDVAGK